MDVCTSPSSGAPGDASPRATASLARPCSGDLRSQLVLSESCRRLGRGDGGGFHAVLSGVEALASRCATTFAAMSGYPNKHGRFGRRLPDLPVALNSPAMPLSRGPSLGWAWFASEPALELGLLFNPILRVSIRKYPQGKYSEIVWSSGTSAQVSARMSSQRPRHFRIVTPQGVREREPRTFCLPSTRSKPSSSAISSRR